MLGWLGYKMSEN